MPNCVSVMRALANVLHICMYCREIRCLILLYLCRLDHQCRYQLWKACGVWLFLYKSIYVDLGKSMFLFKMNVFMCTHGILTLLWKLLFQVCFLVETTNLLMLLSQQMAGLKITPKTVWTNRSYVKKKNSRKFTLPLISQAIDCAIYSACICIVSESLIGWPSPWRPSSSPPQVIGH